MITLNGHTFAFPLCLAPMAGYTDSPFRTMCRAYGADIVTTEMVSAKGLWYGSAKTASLLTTCPSERPVAVQLFGSDPAILADMAARVSDEMGCALLSIDLNMGCPAPKIANNGEGSALMRTPALAASIIALTVKRARVPVTVKFRKGWSAREGDAVSFARLCEESGAAAITVHPRTREQMYAGKADWAVLAAVKQAVRIPVIGNGDVSCGADALRMRDETGVDGVMIGRGALGNPFVFAEIRAALTGMPYSPPSEQDRREAALRLAETTLAEKGPHAIVELRKHLAWFVRHTKGAATLRTRINACSTLEELRSVLRR